jgi:hypothetical protein
MYHCARTAIQNDLTSRSKYAALRSRGHSHGRALRSVGDRLLNIACAMLKTRRTFDPETSVRPLSDGPPLPSLAIHLGRTKTTSGEQDDTVYLTGRPVDALNAWMTAAKIDKGSVFRGIGRWGTVSKRALDPQSINAILKQRAEMAGLESGEFSAHGLRAGYLTEAANRGIPLPRGYGAVASSLGAAGIELLQ